MYLSSDETDIPKVRHRALHGQLRSDRLMNSSNFRTDRRHSRAIPRTRNFGLLVLGDHLNIIAFTLSLRPKDLLNPCSIVIIVSRCTCSG